MKKLVSMMLALTFAASCAAPAFAAPAPLLSETETVPEYATQAAVGMTEAEIQEYAHMDIQTLAIRKPRQTRKRTGREKPSQLAWRFRTWASTTAMRWCSCT